MREYAKRRLALGFNDNGQEEVDDKIIDDLEYKDMIYQMDIKESKERKPAKIVADIKGISKEELKRLNLTKDEKFEIV